MLGQERQVQPLHDLETPSANLAPRKSWNNQTKGFSGSPALHPSASQRRPITESSHRHPHRGGTRALCSSAILQHPQPSGPFLSSTSSTKLFHFELRIIHFLAGLPWSSSLWQPKASQTFIRTTARRIPEKLFSLLCSWKHESQQRHNKLEKFIRARAVLSEPRGMERAAQCPEDETPAL